MFTPRLAGSRGGPTPEGAVPPFGMELVSYDAFCGLLTSRKPLERILCPEHDRLGLQDRETGKVYVIEESQFSESIARQPAGCGGQAAAQRPR